ncbi:MAG TPA: hypothetical protein VNO86_02795 [Candidatus Binatia bacterium]|nr:hypothetical protein [Candidatus Binatia bacterium]
MRRRSGPRSGADRRGILRLPAALLLAAAAVILPLGGALGGPLGAVLGPSAGVGVARAATPELTLVADTRYDVDPAGRRLRVTADLRLTNTKADTVTRRYYFDSVSLAVLPGIRNVGVSGGSGRPTVRIVRRTSEYTLLSIGFGQRLYSKQSLTLRLRFDVPDPGGSPNRQIRVGDALVMFPVWALGTGATPGGTVTVVFPPGFHVELVAGTLSGPETAPDGSLVYRSGRLADPLAFFAYLVGEREGAYQESLRTTRLGDWTLAVRLRAWVDDPEWAERVGGLFVRGLPVIGELVGLPYSGRNPLVVTEAASRVLGGYAGLFDPEAGELKVSYAAEPFVILHEAAHAWFNGRLFADRWIVEAFASLYAERAGAVLGVPVEPPRPPESGSDAETAIPLNAWGPVGSEDPTTEAAAYAAALDLARAIAERLGDEGLRRVLAAAAEHRSAYQPVHGGPVEPDGTTADWRILLDLLEAEAGRPVDDLWRRWVARPEDLPLLAARAAARDRYAAVVRAAGDWELPAVVRSAMRTWQFETAEAVLDEAERALDFRARVEAAASRAGLRVPPTLEAAFEGSGGPGAAIEEAEAELAAIRTIEAAAAARPAEETPLVQLGLLDVDPAGELEAARAAFAAGDLEGAVARAEAARHAWATAEEMGFRRAIGAGSGAAAVLLGLALLGSAIRRRRRATSAA